MSGETEMRPSSWTTDTLHSQLTILMEEREKRYEAARQAIIDMFNTRLDAIDKATDKFEANLVRVPTDVEDRVGQLRDVIQEQFKVVDARFGTVGEQLVSIANEFRLRNENEKQQAIDRKEELKTALSAAEKAVDKSGTATGELLRQQVEQLRSTKEALDIQIGDVKVRLATAEANASSAEKSAASALASQRSDTTIHQVDRGYSTQTMFNAVMAIGMVGAIAVAILKP